jgi:hypothetical protein
MPAMIAASRVAGPATSQQTLRKANLLHWARLHKNSVKIP